MVCAGSSRLYQSPDTPLPQELWIWALRGLQDWLGGLPAWLSPSVRCGSAPSCPEQRDTRVPLGGLQDQINPGGSPGRPSSGPSWISGVLLESVPHLAGLFLFLAAGLRAARSSWATKGPCLLFPCPQGLYPGPCSGPWPHHIWNGLGCAQLRAGPILARGQPSASCSDSWACLGVGICLLGWSGSRGFWALTASVWEVGGTNWLVGARTGSCRTVECSLWSGVCLRSPRAGCCQPKRILAVSLFRDPSGGWKLCTGRQFS